MPLTAVQISNLRAARDIALADPTDSNLTEYYSVLHDAGISYAHLAKGVIFNNTSSGVLANNYAENKLVHDRNHSFTSVQQTLLKRDLMSRDFAAREAIAFREINGQTISDYHDASFSFVFTGINGADQAWTPYHIVRALGNYESWQVEGTLAYVELATDMWLAYIAGDANARSHASAWLQDMTFSEFRMLDTSTDALVYGDGVFAATVLEWLTGSGQQQHGNFYDGELTKFALGGAAVDVPLVGAGIELAIAEHVAQSDGGSVPSPLFTAANGVQATAATILTSSGPGADPVALQIVKAGIKYDLAGDPGSLQTVPVGHATDFSLIDDFQVQSLVVQTSAAQISAQGTGDGDLFIGGAASSDFSGAGGDDMLYGGGGADRLDGGTGNDVALGGAGADWLVSTEGQDILDGGAGNDIIDLTGSTAACTGVPTGQRPRRHHDTRAVPGWPELSSTRLFGVCPRTALRGRIEHRCHARVGLRRELGTRVPTAWAFPAQVG